MESHGGTVAFEWIDTRLICDDPSEPDTCSDVDFLRLGERVLDSPSDRFDYLPGLGGDPEWSPDGDELVYMARPRRLSGHQDIKAIRSDRTGQPRDIVVGPETDVSPAWSPDSSKIVFRRDGDGTVAGLWVVGADGSGATRIRESGMEPDWQPVHTPSSHVRPLAASPTQVSLVPAYRECTGTSNRTHGPPLAYPSCAPPVQTSPNLTVRGPSGDSLFKSFIRVAARLGVPGGVDDTDVRLQASLTHVQHSSDFSEYLGELRVTAQVRVTDKEGPVSSTIQDFPLEFDVPCVSTPDPNLRSTCDIVTGLDAVIPGTSPEGTRAVWALDQVKVYDGGPDEDTGTEGDNSLFATQGLFVP